MTPTALLLAGVSTLMPLAAMGAAVPETSAAEAGAFIAPAEPTQLTRSVRRVLPDGKEVIASRTYALRFVRDGAGYRVEGELVDSACEAPPALRALAEIERKRADVGLFPLRLDAAGRIVASGASGDADRQREAAAAVGGKLAVSAMAPQDKAQAEGFVAQLVARGGGLAAWPADLFVARSGERSEVRRMPLAGGGEGTVTVSTKAGGNRAGGVPATLERTVTTELGGDRRTVRELWTMAPA